MPQFTQWNVPDPFPNVLYNPAAVDAAIAKTQSELGNLDVNRQRLGLEQRKLDLQQSAGEGLLKSLGGDGTTGTTGASVGPLADAAPDQSRDAAGQASYNFWVGKGLAPHQAAGMAAQEVAESGGRPHVVGDGGDAFGLYQHHPDRRALILAKAGIDMNKPDANTQREGAYWELMNVEHGARQRLFASKDADEAGRAATEFERPDSKRRAIIDAERGRDARRIFMLANPNGAAGLATASVDPNAGPRAGRSPAVAPAPPTVTSTTPTTPVVVAPAVNPNAGPRVGAAPTVPPIPPAVVPAADPNARVEADDPNTAAVKQASAALLNMPEADAAAAYPAVVRELQARGFAMQAPPTYPGHAALQALVGGGEPAVAQTKTAMRLGGTDVAGPGAGQATVPSDVQPNRLAYGTDLPGVTIGMPGNGMAPPAAAPVVTAAAPPSAAPTRPPVVAPPPAPSRAIPIEAVLPNGLTASQVRLAASMVQSGAPVADVAAHLEQWRQANRSGQQQQATQAALDAQAQFERQKYYVEQQQKAEQTQYERTRNAAADARAEQAAKDAKLPPGYRLSDTGVATRIDGLPPDPQVAQAGKDAWEAEQRKNPVRGEGLDAQHENTVLQLYPSILDGTATPAQRALYALHYGAMKQGSPEWVDDPTKPGTKMLVRVPREIPSLFPSPDYKPGDPSPGAPGAPAGVQPIPGASKQDPMTMEQGKAAGYADRVQQALPVITDTSPAAMSRWQMLLGKAPILGNTFVSPEFQLHQQSERNFINAVLRRESGAAINPDEFVQARQQYIPQPGDSPQVLAEKAKNRETVLAGMIREAGPGYKPATGAATTTQPPTPKVIEYDATGKRVAK